MHGPHLLHLVHRRPVDLLLRVEARPHRPLVDAARSAARSRGSARPWRWAARTARTPAARRVPAAGSSPPTPAHLRVVLRLRRGVGRNQPRRDEVGLARVGKRHQRPRRRHHAVALVLRVGRVAEALRERVVGRGAAPASAASGTSTLSVSSRYAFLAGFITRSSASSSGRSASSRPKTVRTASADQRLGVRGRVDQLRHAAAEPRVEGARQAVGDAGRPRELHSGCRPRDRLHGHAVEELRVVRAHGVDHRRDDRRASRRAHRPSSAIRHSRYSVMPETVCTIAVNAASGIT